MLVIYNNHSLSISLSNFCNEQELKEYLKKNFGVALPKRYYFLDKTFFEVSYEDLIDTESYEIIEFTL